MSVVIPICIGVLFLQESVNALKLLGIAAGIAAVFLSAGNSVKVSDWKWPVLVFLGSGVIDASFKLFQVWGVTEAKFPELITTIFSFAFLTGVIHHTISTDRSVNSKSVIGGIALGVTNLGSIFFILKALAQPNWESSVIYPINNFGAVVASTLVALLLFGEKLSPRGVVGVLLAVASIGLLFFGNSSA